MLESLCHGDSTVVTLTYHDEDMPRLEDGRGTLQPKDLQNWLKRFRKSIEPERIRFFGCGEYGSITQRPHYHVALFGYQNCRHGVSQYTRYRSSCCAACDNVRDTWGAGNVHLMELSPATAQYVSGYVTKKMTASDDPRLLGRHPEFARMSNRPGLGAEMMWEVASSLMEHNLEDRIVDVPSALRHGSRLLPLGRYLQQKLRTYIGRDEKAPPEVLEKLAEEMSLMQEAAQALADKAVSKHGVYGKELRRLLSEVDDQSVANMAARQAIWKKRDQI